jgi:hypothetical protein
MSTTSSRGLRALMSVVALTLLTACATTRPALDDHVVIESRKFT